MKQTLLFMAVLAWANAGVAAEFEFVRSPDRAVGSWPEAVAIGDVNGDRLDDVILATNYYFDEANDYHLFVYLQQSDGTLAQPFKQKYAESSQGVDIALADLNADGLQEIILGVTGRMLVLASDGTGGFTTRIVATPDDIDIFNVEVLDIDSDGKLDVVGQSWSRGAALFYGDGRGGFDSVRPLATSANGYNDLKVGDVTGDGRPDLVITSEQSTHFYIYPHDGDAGFGPEIAYENPGTDWRPSAAAIGDFDGDGGNDVAVSIPANQPEAAVWIYRGQGAAGFGTPSRWATHDLPAAMMATDLDGDGRDDLLAAHRGWNTIGRYMQGDAGLGLELLTAVPFEADGRALAIGDINDDGCTDVAIANHNVGLVTLQGRNCIRLPARSDFNGDGLSDLLWHHAATGASSIWLGGEAGNSVRPTRVGNPAWRVLGSGDFNGDGESDMLWRNSDTGANAIWASANSATQLPVTRVNNLAWSVVGIGDFDGDGQDDLLWRSGATGANAIWKSGNYLDQQAIAGVANPSWEVVAVDDFNDDGKDDIFWRNRQSGANSVWRSGDHRQHQPITAVADGDWRVAGTGDFNGDGQADVLWRNRRHGRNALWHSASSENAGVVATVANLDWEVAAVADYDGNGRPEIMWRNRRTGEDRLWRSTQVVVERPVTDVADPRWRVVR